MLEKVKTVFKGIIELGLLLIAVTVVLQILFGAVVPFIKIDVIGAILGILTKLGNKGLVGLLALGVILYLFQKSK